MGVKCLAVIGTNRQSIRIAQLAQPARKRPGTGKCFAIQPVKPGIGGNEHESAGDAEGDADDLMAELDSISLRGQATSPGEQARCRHQTGATRRACPLTDFENAITEM
jgi:hypothetical protein